MSNIPEQELLPTTASVSEDDRLSIGGCDVRDLVEEFGSPLYVYDEQTLRGMCRDFVSSFTSEYPRTRIEYSSKAFANPTVAKIIDEEGLYMDIVTGGELAVAIAANFPAERLNFHGNNKGREELVEAVNYGIDSITIDSFAEIDLLSEVAVEQGVRQKVMLRLSPSIDPHTHMLTSTGILDSKFGFSIETGDAETAVEQALAKDSLEVEGLHFHLGSPIFELEPYSEAIDYVLQFAANMRDKYGLVLKRFSPGGGFAIGYVADTLPPSMGEYAKEIATAIRSGCDRYGLDEPELTVEPGRAIVGRAGIAVYTVGGVKTIPGVRTYVSVDGGMGDNIRPALYGARYAVVPVDRPTAPRTRTVTVVGKFCESGDFLARDVDLPEPETGELLALPASGAYCLMMASNYNMQTRPAVVLVNNGKARLMRRRETYSDLLAGTLNLD
ncbi:MAG: diaminopimelate decarboxylase [Chloroflexi bacterium]|nr:diaminopimelate decarboxylase [Chloroflexota bacterium]